MAKICPDGTLDGTLDNIALSTVMVACSAQPTTYAEATSTYALADVTMAGGDFTKADDTSGRKVTMAAKSAVPIDTTGTATHVALCTVAGSVLRYVTTCTSQALTSGGTVDFPAWKVNIADPT